MNLFKKFNLLLIVSFIVLYSSTIAFSQEFKTEFEISMENPWNHYYTVEMTINDLPRGDYVDLIQPVWTPGSYKLREFSQFVQEEKALDENGNEIKFEKIAKNKWRIHRKGLKNVKFQYKVFAFEKSIRHCYLDDSRAVINGAHMYLYPEPFKDQPSKVKINPYKDFKQIATGLRQDPNDKFTLYADNFDVLYDSPIEIGNQDLLEFTVGKAKYILSISGNKDHDGDLLLKHTKRIVEETVKIIGDVPYDKYVFFMAKGIPGGGIEHSNSTFLGLQSWGYSTERQVEGLTGLIAHEFFHTWNVKRIRPFPLGPFDYSKENYSKSLWVAEGFTSYYANLIKLRAGYFTADSYIKQLAGGIGSYFNTEGRKIQSAEEASFDSWIKSYLRHQNSGNTTISYYSLGSLIGTMLDILIVDGSDSKNNLDDMMRYVYNEYHIKKGRGFKPEEFQKAAEKIGDRDLNDFFDKSVRGREAMDFAGILNLAGLEFSVQEDYTNEPDLGASIRVIGGKMMITFIPTDSPAYLQGLSINDEIIGINGIRVTSMNSITRLMSGYRSGDEIEITFSRNEKIRSLNLKLGIKNRTKYSITKIQNPTQKQRQVFEKWLSSKF